VWFLSGTGPVVRSLLGMSYTRRCQALHVVIENSYLFRKPHRRSHTTTWPSRNYSFQSCRQPSPAESNSDDPAKDVNNNTIYEGHRPTRIVIGITGATGTIYAIRLLMVLRNLGVETHLVISKWALATMKYETSMTESAIHNLASRVYRAKDMTAPIASGSFLHDGMIIAPCSMKTLAAIRSGFCDDLISRAADVTLKERRPLMLVVRETPLSDIHLDNMLFLRRAGAVIFPPMPAFYTKPQTIDDVVDQNVGRMLDSFGLHTNGFKRWNGFEKD
jgi:4-hydroxy-3-polyprenylbenzoate decarboxylase